MVIVDKPMPEKCAGCWAMRCSKCIISDSKNIMEYQSNGTKPIWCPVKEDVDKLVSKLDYEIQVAETIGDDDWVKGKIYGIDSVISLLKDLKDSTIKKSDKGYTGTCPKCGADILCVVEITECWNCGTSVKLHKLDKKSEEQE